jgi:hypothetical protein
MPTVSSSVRKFAGSQAGLARALWWAVRLRADVGPTDLPLPYNGLDRAVLWTITALGVLETAIVHVLVSWPVLRWPLLVTGVYGLLAFLAFHFTMGQHPHLLRGDVLLLRFGHFRSARVPLDALVSVARNVENAHRKNVALAEDGLAVSYMGGTNVELRFSPDTVVELDGQEHAVSRVAFQAVDPRAVTTLLRTRGRRP